MYYSKYNTFFSKKYIFLKQYYRQDNELMFNWYFKNIEEITKYRKSEIKLKKKQTLLKTFEI